MREDTLTGVVGGCNLSPLSLHLTTGTQNRSPGPRGCGFANCLTAQKHRVPVEDDDDRNGNTSHSDRAADHLSRRADLRDLVPHVSATDDGRVRLGAIPRSQTVASMAVTRAAA